MGRQGYGVYETGVESDQGGDLACSAATAVGLLLNFDS
jgi:hypothetical protein